MRTISTVFMLACAAPLLVACVATPDASVPPSNATPQLIGVADMPAFCRGEASAAFGARPQEIVTQAAQPDQGLFSVPGSYITDAGTPVAFICTFTGEGGFVGVDAI